MAILNFDYGTLEHWWGGNQDIGQGISDLLVDELVNDGSYRVIERKRLDAILAEQNFAQSERADPSAKTLAHVGQALGVKDMIVGSITKFGTEKSNKSFGAGGFGSKYGLGEVGTAKGKANVAISARMIDTSPAKSSRSPRGMASPSAAVSCWAGARAGVAAPASATSSSALGIPRHDPRRSNRDGRQGDGGEADRRQVTAAVASRRRPFPPGTG